MIDPADASQLDALLSKHRIDLQHRLGQNFLVDPQLRDVIASAAGTSVEDDVLEVGSGVGTLTLALAPLCKKVVAVEFDRRLIPPLREVTQGHANIEIVQMDILRFDLAAAFPDGGEVVVGNIPYNVTGALLRKLLDHEPRPKRLSLVVQKEVAERWTASIAASLSTVAVQVYAKAEMVMTIAAASFVPAPRVDSALVSLDVRAKPAVAVDDMDGFFRFAETVFQFRRKQLGGALARIKGMTSTEAAERLSELGIEAARRPQTLTLPEWEAVYGAFNSGGAR